MIKVNDLSLIPLHKSHFDQLYSSLQDKKLTDTYPISLPFSVVAAQSYLAREVDGREKGDRFSFAVEVNGQFSGVCALYDVDHFNHKAKVYYWIAVESWGKGIATKAVNQLINMSKIEFNLVQLKTGLLERNHASRRVLEKNGFLVENTLINEGKYHQKFLGEKFIEMKLDLRNHLASTLK